MYMYMPSYFLVGGIRSSVLSLVQFSLSLLWNEMYGNIVFKSRSDISHTNYRKENYTSDKHSETLLVLVLHLLTLSTMKFSFHCSLLLKNAKSSTGSTAQIFFAPLRNHFQMPWIRPEWVSIHHFQWQQNLSEL